jgi:hypothetical protein
MTDEWRIGKSLEETVAAWTRYYPDICLDRLRKTTKNFSQKSQWLSWDSNRSPPEYNSKEFLRMILLDQNCLIICELLTET